MLDARSRTPDEPGADPDLTSGPAAVRDARGRFVAWNRQKVAARRDFREWAARKAEIRAAVDTAATGDYLIARVARGTAYAHPGVTRYAAELRALCRGALGRDLREGELAVLGWVAGLDLGLGRGGGAVVSHAQVSAVVGCSQRTAGTRVRLLCDLGLLERDPHFQPTGRGRFCRRGPNLLRVAAAVRAIIERERGARMVPATAPATAVDNLRSGATAVPRLRGQGRGQDLPASEKPNPNPRTTPAVGQSADDSRPAAAVGAPTPEGKGEARTVARTVTPTHPPEAPEGEGTAAAASVARSAPASRQRPEESAEDIAARLMARWFGGDASEEERTRERERREAAEAAAAAAAAATARAARDRARAAARDRAAADPEAAEEARRRRRPRNGTGAAGVGVVAKHITRRR